MKNDGRGVPDPNPMDIRLEKKKPKKLTANQKAGAQKDAPGGHQDKYTLNAEGSVLLLQGGRGCDSSQETKLIKVSQSHDYPGLIQIQRKREKGRTPFNEEERRPPSSRGVQAVVTEKDIQLGEHKICGGIRDGKRRSRRQVRNTKQLVGQACRNCRETN